MHKLLIPLLICLTASFVHAQVPRIITVNPKVVTDTHPPDNPDAACFAGTFTLGQFIGQSNDHDLDTIYLCLGDSILIDHNGDQMFMDPDPLTPPGIGYAYYQCPPTATGDEMIVKADPCLWPGAGNNGFFAVTSQISGDDWFFNSGALINSVTFGNGNPVLIQFAPITITDFIQGALEPGCVDVNINAAFAVVYMKAITESGVSSNFGDDCKGKFRLRGGYPEWNTSATYTVDIRLASDPTVKALIYTPPAQMKHGNDVIFSVPQSGVYNVVVEDGKSCGHTFQINMNVCNPANNVTISLPEKISPPGSQICIPISVENFTDIFGASFSLTWDPAILQYSGIQNPNPALGPFNAGNNLNEINTTLGYLGIVYYDNAPIPIGATIPFGQTMVEVCFNVIGPLGSCSPLDVISFPTLVTMDNLQGESLAVSVDTGQVCADLIPLTVEFGVAPPNCTDASLSFIIHGGTPPYELSWENLATGSPGILFTNAQDDTTLTNPQMEGTYSVCVTDDNGFGIQICDTVTIDVPSLGATLVFVQSPTCHGSMDGSIRADVSVDGVILPPPAGPNYTFTWSPGTLMPVQEQTSVKAGNYVVTVTDTSNGCTSVASGALSEPAPITTQINMTQASCPGIADGCIDVAVNGGTPFPNNEYFFAWEYSPNASGTPLFNDETGSANPFNMCNKPAGYYFLTITDANGCTHTEEVQLTNLREVTIDLMDLFDPTCTGLSDGSIQIQFNAQPPFVNPDPLFFWSSIPAGGPYPQMNNGTVSLLSDLPARTYLVQALDITSGCSDTATFVLTDPPLLMVTATPNDPSCQFQNDGSILAVGQGGTGGPNYTYTWATDQSGVVIPNGPNPTGLTAGTYTVTVTDANGCSVSTTTVLTLPPPPAITSIDSTSVKCGSDGSLTVVSPTATSFAWTTLNGDLIGNTASISGLPGDTYIVIVRDAQNCVNTDTVSLASVVPMSFADTSFNEPICFGGADGSVAIAVQGGKPGPNNSYVYLWSSGQNTPVLFGISSGVYTVTVTDLNNCTLTGTFALNDPPAINISSSLTQAKVSCPGICDGAASLTVTYIDSSGTSIPGNFNFAWSDLAPGDSIRTDLCAGITKVTVTDGKNCFSEADIEIDSVPVIKASFNLVPVTCYGGNDGIATATGSGGNGSPYQYQWSTGAVVAQATGLDAMDHTVTVTDNNNCQQVFVVMVPQPDSIVLTVKQDQIDCFGGNTGGIEAIATGGNAGGYTFTWADQNNNSLGTDNPISNLSAGAYSVTVTDTKGCTQVLPNIPLSDPPAVQGAIRPWEELLCHGDETTLYIDSIFGGSGAPYQYSLDYGVYLNKDFPVTMGGGKHYITFIDRLGCEFTDTIDVFEPGEISVTFPNTEVEIVLGDTTLQLEPIINGAAVVDMFTWTPPELLSNPDTLEPYVLTYESQTYTLVIYDEKGCSATGSIRINIDPNRNVYIPNIFRPGNPAGINDHFNPVVGLGVEGINYMRIFDRWGNLMYERNKFYPDNNNFAEGWDGKYRGDYVNPGVYVYVIEVKFLDKRVLLYRGDVTVYR